MPGAVAIRYAAEMYQKHHDAVIEITTIGRGASRNVSVRIDKVPFSFRLTNFPDNCGAMIVSYIIPYMAKPERFVSLLGFINYIGYYGKRSGMIYTAIGDQQSLRKGLLDCGWEISDVNYRNRNTGNTIFTYVKGVSIPRMSKKKEGKK